MKRIALASALALLSLGQAAHADPQDRWRGSEAPQNGERHWRDRDGDGQGEFRGRRGPEVAPQPPPAQRPPQQELSGGPPRSFDGDRSRGNWAGDHRRDGDFQANRDIDRQRRDFGRPDSHSRNEWERNDGGRNDWGRNDWRHEDHGRNDWGRNDWGRNDWSHNDDWRRDHDDARRAFRDRDRGRSWYAPDRYRPYFHAPYRFRAPPYRYPAGWFAREWRYGEYLPYGWFEPYYYLDWRAYGLDYPPVGCEWVRVGQDALLIDIYTGQILSVAYAVFW